MYKGKHIKTRKVRVICFYLPQYHPIPENDQWWGKGFTEWTNVGKAKPLFPGHYQPKIPTDLGYYDLRLPETREAQAQMANEYGIEGFCYWHYWFGNGKRLLERPFEEVLNSGKPDFPFCLGWANHSWKAKTWSEDGNDKMLIEQQFNGIEDYKSHFFSVLRAFRDKRYIRKENKPLFVIWNPNTFKDISSFIGLWNDLAIENGLNGIYFVAYSVIKDDIEKFRKIGFDAVTFDFIGELFGKKNLIYKSIFKLGRSLFSLPKILNYNEYIRVVKDTFNEREDFFPCILPNFDHSPRSGKNAWVLINSTPQNFGMLLHFLWEKLSNTNKGDRIIFIKSWNEWGEGNYLEPDLKYGKDYLAEVKKFIEKFN